MGPNCRYWARTPGSVRFDACTPTRRVVSVEPQGGRLFLRRQVVARAARRPGGGDCSAMRPSGMRFMRAFVGGERADGRADRTFIGLIQAPQAGKSLAGVGCNRVGGIRLSVGGRVVVFRNAWALMRDRPGWCLSTAAIGDSPTSAIGKLLSGLSTRSKGSAGESLDGCLS